MDINENGTNTAKEFLRLIWIETTDICYMKTWLNERKMAYSNQLYLFTFQL